MEVGPTPDIDHAFDSLGPAMSGVFEGDTQRFPSESEARLMLAAIIALSRFAKKHADALTSQVRWDAGITGRYRVPALGNKLDVRLTAQS